MKYHGIDLGVNFCGVSFQNPFILSAAPPTDDLDMVRRGFEAGWAGAVLKTTSVEGNPVDLAYPMMSGLDYESRRIVGLGNIDLISEHHIDVIEERVGALKAEFPDKIVIASMMGASKENWQGLVRRLEAAGVDIIECSFSCPQGSMGEQPGAMLAQSIDATEKVARWVKEAAERVPVVIKITPQVTDIVAVARAVKRSGADAICASNTIPSLMGIDIRTFVPIPDVAGKSTYSGLSGPAIKPITLRTIAEIKKSVDIPITGTGGPTTWKDAVEFMLVGASTVQFCTAVMHYGYDIIQDLTDGLAFYMEDMGFERAEEIVGKSLPHIVTHDELSRAKKVISKIDEDLCVKCDLCYIACQDGGHQAILLEESGRIPKTDEEKCVGCGLCPLVCPADAITMVERETEKAETETRT
jgi:dihydropyrimidine dehydrogenase (NAD+) subunit PreA